MSALNCLALILSSEKMEIMKTEKVVEIVVKCRNVLPVSRRQGFHWVVFSSRRQYLTALSTVLNTFSVLSEKGRKDRRQIKLTLSIIADSIPLCKQYLTFEFMQFGFQFS